MQEPFENLKNYWTNLDFEYIRTYSGLRSEDFLNRVTESRDKIKSLNRLKSKLTQNSKLEVDQEILRLEEMVHGSVLYSSNEKVSFHSSTTLVAEFDTKENIWNDLNGILTIPFVEQALWMCAPVYRDAIVFYSSSHDIRGVLQICFGCEDVINERNNQMEVDDRIFPKLKELMIGWGHTILPNEADLFSRALRQ